MSTELPEGVELSEFSLHEVLYMGSDAMTFYVEHQLGDAYADPFEIIAALEEEMRTPLAKRRSDM